MHVGGQKIPGLCSSTWWCYIDDKSDRRISGVFVIVCASLYTIFLFRYQISLSTPITEMPQRFANKVTAEKTAAISEAIPWQAPKNRQKENPNAPEKGQVATSWTTKPRLACHKHVALLVTTFTNNHFLNLDRLLLIYSLVKSAVVKSLTSLMKTTRMMTVTIPHPKLMKRILCSNPSSPCLLGTP